MSVLRTSRTSLWNSTAQSPLLWILPLLAVLTAASGCSRTTKAIAAPPPLQVEVANVEQRDVPIYKEWIGTLDGLVNADIKAQVSGYLTKQAYTEGTFVKRGQLLFQIDPRPFQAALDQAQGHLAQSQGQLEQARAQLAQAQARLRSPRPISAASNWMSIATRRWRKQQAITQQDLDNATQNNMAAKAQLQAAKAQVETGKAQITAALAAVQSAKAAVETARINLGFTRVTSPIDGIPGIAQQQVGALVSPASGAITTVSTVDPIKVYFTVSEQEYLDYARRFPTAEKRQANNNRLELELILADGATYPHKGKVLLRRPPGGRPDRRHPAGRIVPESRQQLASRPVRPGPHRHQTSTRALCWFRSRRSSICRALTRSPWWTTRNKVSIRAVTLGETVGHEWIVRDGVKPGERVIVEGLQKVRQGMQVNPKPFRAR